MTPLASDGRIAIRRILESDLDAPHAAIDESRTGLVAMRANRASCRAAGKAVARFECHARNRPLHGGHWHEAAVVSLVPGDLD